MTALEHFARPMLTRKTARLSRLKKPRRTLAIACFLRLMLLRLSDAAIERLDHRIAISGEPPTTAPRLRWPGSCTAIAG